MGNQQERFDLDLAWLAGIIEGEGWISLALIKSLKRSGKYYPAFLGSIGVTNTDFLLTDKVEEIFKKLGLRYRKQERPAYTGKDGSKRKPKREFSVNSSEHVIKLSQAILPYVYGEKGKRILKLLEFYEIRSRKPRCGINSVYGPEEYEIYKSMYSYKGKSRSEIPNDCTFGVPLAEDKDTV